MTKKKFTKAEQSVLDLIFRNGDRWRANSKQRAYSYIEVSTNDLIKVMSDEIRTEWLRTCHAEVAATDMRYNTQRHPGYHRERQICEKLFGLTHKYGVSNVCGSLVRKGVLVRSPSEIKRRSQRYLIDTVAIAKMKVAMAQSE